MRGRVSVSLFAALCFVEIGFAQWTRLGTPEIIVPISPTAIAVNGDTLLVGTYRSTTYRSTNHGSSWAKSDSGVSLQQWTFDFLTAGDTIYSMGENGIFRSTNLGTTWDIKNNGLKVGSLMNVHSMTWCGNQLFAGTDYGVYQSTNNGDYWNPVTSVSQVSTIYSLASSDSFVFAGMSATGIVRSTDNGNSWSAANAGLPVNAGGYIDRINKLFIDGNNIYAGTNNSGVYRSSDNGISWQPDTTGLNTTGTGYFFSIYALARAGNYIYAGTEDDGIYRAAVDGGTWVKVSTGLPPDAYVETILSKGNQIFITTYSSGLLYSASIDSIAWIPLFTQFPGQVNVTLVGSFGSNLFLGATSDYFNGSTSGIFRSPFSLIGWTLDSYLSSKNINSFYAYGDSLYAQGNGLFFLSGTSSFWREIDSSIVSSFLKSNDTLFVGWGWEGGGPALNEQGGVYYSTNNGESWSEPRSSDTAVFAIAKIGGNLFSCGWHGAFRSTTLGLTWTPIDSGLPQNPYVYSLNSIGNTLLACVWQGIYRSNNNGDNWVFASTGLPIDSGAYSSSIILLTLDTQLIAGSIYGVYVSTNMGANWNSANTGLVGNALNIQSLTVCGNNLVVTTKDGLWERPLAELLSVKNMNNIVPQEFSLSQNFPNPFNPSTVISYQLPASTLVTLKVYDELGRLVRTLVEDRQTAGTHSVTFNASNLSSGIYFYRLTAGSFVQTKKLMLLK